MDKIKIINGTDHFFLNKHESINLEIKLNVTKYGKDWSHIGDDLYNFGICKKDSKNIINVSKEQYSFLHKLHLQK